MLSGPQEVTGAQFPVLSAKSSVARWPMLLRFHLDPEQEIGVPGGETVERGVGKFCPGRGHLWRRVRGLSRPASSSSLELSSIISRPDPDN